MKRLGIALALLCMTAPAFAEKREWTVGLETGVVLPGFESQDSSAFALATWSIGGVFQYGLFDDLFLQSRFTFSTFGAQIHQTREERGRLDGILEFHATNFHPEIGLRYNVIGGYNFATYIEGLAGFIWSSYADQSFRNDSGQLLATNTPDEGEGVLTVSGGAAFEYRIVNMILVGVAGRYVQGVNSGRFQRQIEIPIQVSFRWM